MADITISTTAAANAIGRPKGRYITLKALDSTFENYCPCFAERVKVLADSLRDLAGGAEKVLVAGLGNRHLTADALGPLVVDGIFATRHIESTEQIKALCEAVRPDIVIAVDALACWELGHLGRTIQLCDTGISPGSGVENARRELSRATLGVTCIAIGVPMVVDLSSAAEMIFDRPAPDGSERMTVTPASADRLVRSAAAYISEAINQAFQPTLTPEELRTLV